MFRVGLWFAVLSVVAAFAGSASAQGTNIPFSALSEDRGKPVEITSDSLTLDQQAGTAQFTGDVVIGQGDLRINADTVDVTYSVENGQSTNEVERLIATGNVILVLGDEAAESQAAEYRVADGIIRLTGNVTLTQGQSAMMGQQLDIDLDKGAGVMSGRVKTILRTGDN